MFKTIATLFEVLTSILNSCLNLAQAGEAYSSNFKLEAELEGQKRLKEIEAKYKP